TMSKRDWSSDVCSSDLVRPLVDVTHLGNGGLGDIAGERRRHELHGLPEPFRVEENRRAQSVGIGAVCRPGFVELVPGLPPGAVACAGQVADQAIATGIDECAGPEIDEPL